ncbi:MAG: hypothetical protein ACOC5L_04930 [Halobacteriota archaeon]
MRLKPPKEIEGLELPEELLEILERIWLEEYEEDYLDTDEELPEELLEILERIWLEEYEEDYLDI